MSSQQEPGATHTPEEHPSEAEKIRNEEYKIWKKSSPFLYDICISKAMPSPSACVQWYPSVQPWTTPTSNSSAFETSQLLLSSAEPLTANTVFRAKCDLPRPTASPTEISAFSKTHSGIQILDADTTFDLGAGNFPCTARFADANPSLVACAGRDGFLKVFKNDAFLADLKHHKEDVLDLSWNPHKETQLLSVSLDGTAALWDIEKPDAPTNVFGGDNSVGYSESRSSALYCSQFAPLLPSELATGGADRSLKFWDLRSGLEKPVRQAVHAHTTGITAMNYSPFNKMHIATGSTDGALSLWDVRMSQNPLLTLQADEGYVNSLRWSPHDESVLATGGADCQVKVWDLSLHGYAQTAAEEEDGPAELIFIHGGHLGAISDLAWHPTLPWTLCSVAEDSLVGIWRIASSIVDNVESDTESQAEE